MALPPTPNPMSESRLIAILFWVIVFFCAVHVLRSEIKRRRAAGTPKTDDSPPLNPPVGADSAEGAKPGAGIKPF